jgi:hypothetical protein
MPGRIPLESLAGIAWNPWPESNGITGRDHVESVAGIVWNLHLEVTYRYFATDDAEFEDGDYLEFESHNIYLGLRCTF